MIIPRGTNIGIPVYAIHHNASNYPEPELFRYDNDDDDDNDDNDDDNDDDDNVLFRPERFFKENAGDLVPGAWVPFGIGPRACIGERFAMIEMKIAMTKLLNNFRLEASEDTKQDFYLGDQFILSYKEVKLNIHQK